MFLSRLGPQGLPAVYIHSPRRENFSPIELLLCTQTVSQQETAQTPPEKQPRPFRERSRISGVRDDTRSALTVDEELQVQALPALTSPLKSLHAPPVVHGLSHAPRSVGLPVAYKLYQKSEDEANKTWRQTREMSVYSSRTAL